MILTEKHIIKKAIGEFQYSIEACGTPKVINYNDFKTGGMV